MTLRSEAGASEEPRVGEKGWGFFQGTKVRVPLKTRPPPTRAESSCAESERISYAWRGSGVFLPLLE